MLNASLPFDLGASSFYDAYFGKGIGPILLNHVSCSSPRSSLLNCNIDYNYNRYSYHNDDAGVRCQCEFLMKIQKFFYSMS